MERDVEILCEIIADNLNLLKGGDFDQGIYEAVCNNLGFDLERYLRADATQRGKFIPEGVIAPYCEVCKDGVTLCNLDKFCVEDVVDHLIETLGIEDLQYEKLDNRHYLVFSNTHPDTFDVYYK